MSAIAPLLLCVLTGCASLPTSKKAPAKAEEKAQDTVAQDSIVLTSQGVVREPIDSGARLELETAKRLFLEKKYAEAEKRFHKLTQYYDGPAWWDVSRLWASAEPETEETKKSKSADSKKKRQDKKINSIIEEAMFLEAECQRLQKEYRDAVDAYTKLLVEFPRSQFTMRACQGLFEIADYWLEPTRRQMNEYHEQLKGKRWMVMPALYVHMDRDMPMLDAEGHALNILNTVRLHDINGPLGEKSLFYLGTIHFFRKDYKEADYYFAQMYHHYPNSDFAAKAVKQSVICKQLSTGGSVYDCRAVEESKKLLMTAQGSYPELAKDEKWIEDQLKSINSQQADRDYKVAEFYQRTGHPGSAYFYFELVRRRYPGSWYANQATKKMGEIRSKVEKEQAKQKARAPDTAAPSESGAPMKLQPAPNLAPPPRTLPPELSPGTSESKR